MFSTSQNLLQVNSVDLNVSSVIKRINEHTHLVYINHDVFYVTDIDLQYKIKNIPFDVLSNSNIKLKKINTLLQHNPQIKKNLTYGGKDSFIVDMQGISSLLYAKSTIFNDYTIRRILLVLEYFKPNRQYLRIGASGSPANDYHPGGEVLEYSFLNGNNGGGMSQTQSGYLPKKSIFSKRIELNNQDKKTLREERALYSHTALLSSFDKTKNNNLCISIKVKSGIINLLEVIDQIVKESDIHAYALQLYIRPQSTCKFLPLIIGRVLKHLPKSQITSFHQVENIASEQIFYLYQQQSAIFYGTNYHRVNKDWEKFRHGKPYEPYGHIHGMITTDEQREDQHNLFHLRKLILFPQNECQIVITPIHHIVTIEPVFLEKNKIISSISKKIITTLQNEHIN